MSLIFEHSKNFLKKWIIKCTYSIMDFCLFFTSNRNHINSVLLKLFLLIICFWLIDLLFLWDIFITGIIFLSNFLYFLTTLFYPFPHRNQILKFHTIFSIFSQNRLFHPIITDTGMLYHSLILLIINNVPQLSNTSLIINKIQYLFIFFLDACLSW